jgi:hypothetical protein
MKKTKKCSLCGGSGAVYKDTKGYNKSERGMFVPCECRMKDEEDLALQEQKELKDKQKYATS